MFEAILKDIRDYSRIIIYRHRNPDGDAIGSQVGLKGIIRENFPDKEVYAVGDAAGRYGFIEGSVMDEVLDDAFGGALAIILDCGGEGMISDDRYRLAARTARIDHHMFAGVIADDEVIDSDFESCCGMIAYMARESGLRLSVTAAKALYTGMVTDSGRFRFDATSARTFEMAAFLMEQHFDTTDIYASLYADELANVQARAAATLKIRCTAHNVAYIYNTAEDVAASGLDIPSISRGQVSVMADIKGIDIWVNFTEAPEGVICEIRSSKYNINPIAVKYGGGGHMKASGATVPDRETAMHMLDDLDALMV